MKRKADLWESSLGAGSSDEPGVKRATIGGIETASFEEDLEDFMDLNPSFDDLPDGFGTREDRGCQQHRGRQADGT